MHLNRKRRIDHCDMQSAMTKASAQAESRRDILRFSAASAVSVLVAACGGDTNTPGGGGTTGAGGKTSAAGGSGPAPGVGGSGPGPGTGGSGPGVAGSPSGTGGYS